MSAHLVVTETTASTWAYHLSEWGAGLVSLCGRRDLMRTEIPVAAWGTVDHIPSRWCRKCEAAARELGVPPEVLPDAVTVGNNSEK